MSQVIFFPIQSSEPGILDWRPTPGGSQDAPAPLKDIQRHFEAPVSREASTLNGLFEQLVTEWHEDTELSSSSTKITTHPSYLRIIGLGTRALPLIFGRLRVGSDHWNSALTAITGEHPVQPNDSGRLSAMRARWLEWAADHGY